MKARALGPVASLRKARLLAGTGIAALSLAAVVAFAAPAFGQDVSGISADCNTVTVGWSGFPSAGVPVHIDAVVGSVGTVSKDLTVDDHTAPTHLDISDYARKLSSIERGIVDVDVTWDLDGPHDAHQIVPVWCGGRVTTTTEGTSGTLPQTDGDGANSNAPKIANVSRNGTRPTSNVDAANVSASSTPSSTAPSGAAVSTSTSTVVVSAAEATHTDPAVSTSGGSLPFTGGPVLPLALVGLALLTMGAAVAHRRRGAVSVRASTRDRR